MGIPARGQTDLITAQNAEFVKVATWNILSPAPQHARRLIRAHVDSPLLSSPQRSASGRKRTLADGTNKLLHLQIGAPVRESLRRVVRNQILLDTMTGLHEPLLLSQSVIARQNLSDIL